MRGNIRQGLEDARWLDGRVSGLYQVDDSYAPARRRSKSLTGYAGRIFFPSPSVGERLCLGRVCGKASYAEAFYPNDRTSAVGSVVSFLEVPC